MTSTTTTFLDEYSAMPTWSGFNYQAKVAIYLVLQHLNDPSKITDISKYSVELEWLEDIAFLKESLYESIHQVKAYKNRTNSKYKKAVAMLVGRTFEKTSIKNCYLHTILQIDPIEQDIVKKCLQDEGAFATKPDFYDVGGGFDTAFRKFKVYTYQGNEYCGLEEIDDLILNEIRTYFDTVGRRVENIGLVRLKLLQRIDQVVMESHHRIQTSADHKTIPVPLNEFKYILDQNHDDPSSAYWLHITKDALSQYCDQYICELEEDEEVTNAWWAAAQIISSFSEDEFVDFARKVNPHKHIGSQFDVNAFKDTFVYEHVRFAFFDALRLITRSIDKSHFVYVKDSKSYAPTTIKGSSGRTKVREQKHVAQQILKNKGLKTLLWEVSSLVSSEMNVVSLRAEASQIFDLELEQASGERERNRITEIGDVSIIDLNTAIEVLATNETDSD